MQARLYFCSGATEPVQTDIIVQRFCRRVGSEDRLVPHPQRFRDGKEFGA